MQDLISRQDVPDTNVGDMISRQDAINTSLEFFVEYLGGAFDENSQKELMVRLQRLPSAQPEVIRCKDCKHRTSYWGNCKLLEEKYHQRVFVGGDSFCSYAERRGEQNDQH